MFCYINPRHCILKYVLMLMHKQDNTSTIFSKFKCSLVSLLNNIFYLVVCSRCLRFSKEQENCKPKVIEKNYGQNVVLRAYHTIFATSWWPLAVLASKERHLALRLNSTRQNKSIEFIHFIAIYNYTYYLHIHFYGLAHRYK